MVKSANTNGLLDDDYDARKYQSEVKKTLHGYLQQHKELEPEDQEQLNPLGSKAIRMALGAIKNPNEACRNIFTRLQNLCAVLQHQKKIYEGNAVLVMFEDVRRSFLIFTLKDMGRFI